MAYIYYNLFNVLLSILSILARSRYADKFKGGLQNKIALIKRDLPPNKLYLGKRQRYKREVIDDKSKESKFIERLCNI